MALTIELQAPDRMLHTRERGFKSITRDWENRWTTQNSRLFEGKTGFVRGTSPPVYPVPVPVFVPLSRMGQGLSKTPFWGRNGHFSFMGFAKEGRGRAGRAGQGRRG